MNTTFTIAGILIALFWVVVNVYTAKVFSAKEMHQEFISGQCFVGKICANIFYAPAWFLKGIRLVVVATIK